MRAALAQTLSRLARWIRPKHAPASLTGNQWTGTSFLDSYHRNRQPNANDLLSELKGTAWTCATLNASVCAAYPPRLYVATHEGQAHARCLTRSLPAAVENRLRASPHLPPRVTKAAQIEEVLDHPLLTLLQKVNPVHNSFDLWELTTLYLEVHGSAYWYLNLDPLLGVPTEIWPLPAQNMTPRRKPDSRNLIDYYEYRNGTADQRFRPEEIIHFRYPDPRNPYTGGLSPLRACFESIALSSDYAAFRQAKFENHAIPDALLSPEGAIGEEERDRLETQWNSYLRRGGAGKVIVAENNMKLQMLHHSMGDLAALADLKATKEDICNAFHVPIAFLTSQTNLANLQASERLHMDKAIDPRLRRRDEKLNEQLIPLYDPTGRLFLASEDPVPVDQDAGIAQQQLDLKFGVVTINEMRGERGLAPVPWGETPWLPLNWAPSDFERRPDDAPDTGRNRRQVEAE
jgi:HK97 family phage portal protein